jgi:hypothetical protein
MTWGIWIVVCGLILIIVGILVQYRLRRLRTLSDLRIKLRTAERIASFDGWASLELELGNQSDFTVWIEEAKLLISDLDAHFQTSLARDQTVHPIRQAVPPDEILSTSLAASFYEAAGRPQGPYSFLVSGTVRYRIDEEWAEAHIRPHSVEMAALSVIRLRPVRKNNGSANRHAALMPLSGSQTSENHSTEKENADFAKR